MSSGASEPKHWQASKRILVADVPAGVKAVENIIGEHATILGADSLAEALSVLRGGVDLVVCGVHFNESRMFDFLRLAKADPTTRAVPFACFRDIDSELSASILQGLGIACSALGAELFVDLYQLKSQLGIEAADKRLRRMLLHLLDARTE